MTKAAAPLLGGRMSALSPKGFFIGLAALFTALAFLAPQTAFLIDDVLYIDMANAMADRASLNITPENMPAGAPTVTISPGLVHVIDGEAVPQYPAGYALLAAPFFALFGVSGLILMNALCAVLSLWLIWRIGLALYEERWIAQTGALLFGLATIFSGYVFAIWPHVTSLAMTLGAALLSIEASGDDSRRRLKILCAGLLLGAAVNIRVDAIVPAIAIFFWLRLFALPKDRIAALSLIAGLAPGFILAAGLNEAKFGVFLPLYYGDKQGLDSAARYAPVALAAFAAIGASLAIDISHKRYAVLNKLNPPVILGIVLAVALALSSAGFFRKLLQGFYFLVVDIQAFDPADLRRGIGRDPFGYWSFWGIPKKALLQSLPFAALALVPITAFLRKNDMRAHALPLLTIAGVIALFSLNAFHGGMTFNMRYFLPAVPFIALLCAYGLSSLRPVMRQRPKLMTRSLIAGAGLALFFYTLLPGLSPALATPAQLYPQLVLFTALAAALSIAIWRARGGVAATVLSGIAIGYAAVLGAADAADELGLRTAKAPYDRAYAAALAPGSLVITTAEDHLIAASLNGVILAGALDKGAETLIAAAHTYEAAGRCVYLQTQYAIDLVGGDGFSPVTVPGLPQPADPALQLYALNAQLPDCAPGQR